MTSYILGCQVFAFVAMVYYGIILFAIRKPKKVNDESPTNLSSNTNTNNEDPFARTDKLMFVIYIFCFAVYTLVHFVRFFDKMI